jgi:hypothetical protein
MYQEAVIEVVPFGEFEKGHACLGRAQAVPGFAANARAGMRKSLVLHVSTLEGEELNDARRSASWSSPFPP